MISNTWTVLKDELEVSMRLCGITSLDETTPALVNTLDVEHMVSSTNSYGPLPTRTPRLSKL